MLPPFKAGSAVIVRCVLLRVIRARYFDVRREYGGQVPPEAVGGGDGWGVVA